MCRFVGSLESCVLLTRCRWLLAEGGTLPATGQEGEAVIIIKRREVAEDYGVAKAILASPKR